MVISSNYISSSFHRKNGYSDTQSFSRSIPKQISQSNLFEHNNTDQKFIHDSSQIHTLSDGRTCKYGYWLTKCKLCHESAKFRIKSIKTCHQCIVKDTIEEKCIDCNNILKKRTKSKRQYCDQCCNLTIESICNTCDQQFKTPKYSKVKKCNKCIDWNKFKCQYCHQAKKVSYREPKKGYCYQCRQDEHARRLHNSIIAVAHLYLRNEDWLNEIIKEQCFLCNTPYQKQRRSIQDICQNCECHRYVIIKGLQNFTINNNWVYPNLYIKITFVEEKKIYYYSSQTRKLEHTRLYPLLKTIKQSNIRIDNKIINPNDYSMRYYIHPDYPQAKITKAVVKQTIKLRD